MGDPGVGRTDPRTQGSLLGVGRRLELACLWLLAPAGLIHLLQLSVVGDRGNR